MRIVCDVPYVGKRWVHQLSDYDEVRGESAYEPDMPRILAELAG